MRTAPSEAANDDEVETALESALRACGGPRSGDSRWRERRHRVMMEYGALTRPDGTAAWPQAAEYVRHQIEMGRALGGR
jgi:hypothetical protein